MHDATELDGFKGNIDLREYATAHGYSMDRRASWRGSAVMRNAQDDKIVIKRDRDGHFVYFSVRDPHDNGSILDFVRHRSGMNLGQIRKRLRGWSGGVNAPSIWPRLDGTPKNRVAVEQRFQAMQDALRHPYLEDVRGLSPALLADARFTGRIRIDRYRNAVFPHFNAEGLCGYELKNRGFTGFAAGGEKGLWCSHGTQHNRCLVIAESAIDALSHAALFPDASARYASIGGKPSPQQPSLLRLVIRQLAPDAGVISAMDNDAEGAKLALIVEAAVSESGRADIAFRSHTASLPCKDWNDVLRQAAT